MFKGGAAFKSEVIESFEGIDSISFLLADDVDYYRYKQKSELMKIMIEGIYNEEFLNLKRQTGDPAADAFINYVFADQERKHQLRHWLEGKATADELDAMFPGFEFIACARELPLWADKKLISAGQAFFAQHAQDIMTLLGLLSLPYCYTAADGAMVLYLSEKIRKQTTKRLYDTAVFVWDVMAPEAFAKGGSAFSDILRIRLVHAAVRFYTLLSGTWDENLGTPINQEDMAGTNLSFSLIVVRGLRKLGIQISNAEQIAFLHIWKVVGYFSGLDKDLLPQNGKMATQLDLAIKKRQFRSSTHGQELTKSLIEHILKVNRRKVSNSDILGLMRHLLGSEVADMLKVPGPELPRYKLTLLRAMKFFKSFSREGNSNHLYYKAYNAFKKQNRELQQKEFS